MWRRDTTRLEICCEECGKWACLYVSHLAMLHLQKRAPLEGRWPADDDEPELIALAERADAGEGSGEIDRLRRLAQAEGLRLTVLEKESWLCPYCGHVCRHWPAE